MAKDLIFKLCTDEEKRLGNNGANEIKGHSFFHGVDFTGNLRKTKALYVPPIKYPTDTSNFEPIENKVIEAHTSQDRQLYKFDSSQNENNENNVENQNNLVNNSKNQILYEFTFRRFFDEAYSEHFNVQSDSEDTEQNFQNRQNNFESHQRRRSVSGNDVNMISSASLQENSYKDTTSKDEEHPAIYV
jgi:hypothetical protein